MWTPDEEKKVARLWLVDGLSILDISEEIGKSSSSVFRCISRRGWKGQKGNSSLYLSVLDPAQFAFVMKEEVARIRPVRIELPTISRPPIDSIDNISLHWGDIHFPFENKAALNVLYQCAAEIQPGTLVCHGDIPDFWQISNQRPPMETKLKADQIDIQESITKTTEHLGQMSYYATPDARKIYLQGNHEDRWERLLLELQTNTRLKTILSIPKVAETMNLDYIIGLGDMGWESHRYYPGDDVVLKNKLLVIHGNRGGLWPTRTHLSQYGKSVMFGHTHRIQNYTQRDLSGTKSAWNIGCLCNMSQWYTTNLNWAHGFAVVAWKEVLGEWYFSVEQIRIHNGVGLWRDHVFGS